MSCISCYIVPNVRLQNLECNALKEKMRILVVDNYDSFTFNLTQVVEDCGAECDVVKNDRLDFNMVRRYKKILISPGPGVPSEAGEVCKLIREFSSGKSILGICLGHQAIAEVFGGELIQPHGPAHGIKKSLKILDRSSYLFTGLPDEIDGGLYHSWSVSPGGFPECLKVIAVTADGTIMALSHREYDVHGIQFHPESVMTTHGRRIMHNWLSHVV
jgi:anthranilate synthase component II